MADFDRGSKLVDGAVLVRRAEAVRAEGDAGSELGRVRAVFSTILADRHGTVFLPSAYPRDLATYQANPVLLNSHDFDSLPIGRVSDLSIDDYALSGVAEFDMDDPEAALIAGKYHRGFMRGFSVRIRVLAAVGEWSDEVKVATLPADLQKALREGDIWAVVTRAEILEISACGIPSNPGALSTEARESRHSGALAEMHERILVLESQLRESETARVDLESAWECFKQFRKF